MNLFALLERRRSVRAFADRPVDKAQLMKILGAARSAPSAGNLQAYHVVVVRDAKQRQRLSHAALGQEHVAEAPVVLVFAQHPARSARKYGQRGARLYAVQDATIACAYAQLAATAVGLGSCWVGAFDPSKVRAAVGLPADRAPVALLVLGHPRTRPGKTPRRPLRELVSWGSFSS